MVKPACRMQRNPNLTPPPTQLNEVYSVVSEDLSSRKLNTDTDVSENVLGLDVQGESVAPFSWWPALTPRHSVGIPSIPYPAESKAAITQVRTDGVLYRYG